MNDDSRAFTHNNLMLLQKIAARSRKYCGTKYKIRDYVMTLTFPVMAFVAALVTGAHWPVVIFLAATIGACHSSYLILYQYKEMNAMGDLNEARYYEELLHYQEWADKTDAKLAKLEIRDYLKNKSTKDITIN
jgi:hypothetical protein